MEVLDLSIIRNSPVTTISTLLVIVLGILYLFLKEKPRGPRGLPFFGILPFLKDETAHLQLKEYTKKYGDVYSFTVLGKVFVHLGTIKHVKEAHVTYGDNFPNKFTEFNVLSLTFKDGFLSLNGDRWKLMRKFFVQNFREYGMTLMQDYMSGQIYESAHDTVSKLRAFDGKSVNLRSILMTQSRNIMRRTLFNDTGITDEELKELVGNYEKLLGVFVNMSSLYRGEFARHFIFPRLPGYKASMASQKIMEEIFEKNIKRHEETFDESVIRDFIDAYIKERNERRRKNDPTSEYFTDNCLIYSLMQIVGDGISSVVHYTNYTLFNFTKYPEEQDKVFKEIQEIVGPNREVTLEDKSKLPHLNAFIQETLRLNDFFNLFLGQECTKGTTIDGCQIPVGATTLMNFYSCHRDPRTFEDPETFRPSRYISEAGKPKCELPILFGVGRRSCAGESFTMMQIFLFVATIIKNFQLSVSGSTSGEHILEGSMEMTVHARKQIL